MHFKVNPLLFSILLSSTMVVGCSKTAEEVQPEKSDAELVKESFDEYENKITSFDLTRYEIDKPNPIQEDLSAKCLNGFGGQSNKIHKGMFSENLFALDAETALTDSGYVGYLPYVKSYTLIGDILFEKHFDGFDRNVITSPQLTRGFSDIQIFDNKKSVHNKFTTMESRFGFPMNYIKQQAGQVVTFSDYNNDCDKNFRVIDRTYEKVNLGNRPISDVLTADFTNTSHHGTNGIYSVTTSNYHYIPENMVKYLQANQNFYKYLSGNTWRFPEGSYMYVPKELNAITESVRVDFNATNKITIPIDDYAKELGILHNNNEQSVVFVEEKTDGFIVLKPHTVPGGKPLHNYGALVIKGDSAYVAEWTPKGKANVSKHDVGASYATMYNDKAITYLVGAIKKNYQGKKLDKGQPWEDMNLKLAQSNLEGVGSEVFDPKDLPLETVEQAKVKQAISGTSNSLE